MRDLETIEPAALSEVTGGKFAEFLAKAQKILGVISNGISMIGQFLPSGGGKSGEQAQQAAPQGGSEGQ